MWPVKTFRWLPLAALCLVIGVSLVISGGTVHLYIAVALFAAAVLLLSLAFNHQFVSSANLPFNEIAADRGAAGLGIFVLEWDRGVLIIDKGALTCENSVSKSKF